MRLLLLTALTFVSTTQGEDTRLRPADSYEFRDDDSGFGSMEFGAMSNFFQDMKKRMKQFQTSMSKAMGQFPSMKFPDMPPFPEVPKFDFEHFEKEMSLLRNKSGGEKSSSYQMSKSVSCHNTNCTICTNGKCINGNYTHVLQESGLCKDAVCAPGCEGFVVDQDPDSNPCPICKCKDFGLIEPCQADTDCRQVTCNTQLGACQYPPPSGQPLRRCWSSDQCGGGEYCSHIRGYCVKRGAH